jgi:hypothetical protein
MILILQIAAGYVIGAIACQLIEYIVMVCKRK